MRVVTKIQLWEDLMWRVWFIKYVFRVWSLNTLTKRLFFLVVFKKKIKFLFFVCWALDFGTLHGFECDFNVTYYFGDDDCARISNCVSKSIWIIVVTLKADRQWMGRVRMNISLLIGCHTDSKIGFGVPSTPYQVHSHLYISKQPEIMFRLYIAFVLDVFNILLVL